MMMDDPESSLAAQLIEHATRARARLQLQAALCLFEAAASCCILLAAPTTELTKPSVQAATPVSAELELLVERCGELRETGSSDIKSAASAVASAALELRKAHGIAVRSRNVRLLPPVDASLLAAAVLGVRAV